MAETLLTPSSIKMYGRILRDLKYTDDAPVIGANNFLQRQLAGFAPITLTGTTTAANPHVTGVSSTAGLAVGMTVSAVTGAVSVFMPNTTIVAIIPPNSFDVNPNASVGAQDITILAASNNTNFARIYAFSFEGAVYSLPKPSIFLVHGTGKRADANPRSNVEISGVAAREWELAKSGTTDPIEEQLRYWEYEKGDFSLRLDTEAGPLEQILLAAAIRGPDYSPDRSGANLGVRSGANLSGANVSGANVSGANVSGANVSGANVRNR
jgi:hypothetical protein